MFFKKGSAGKTSPSIAPGLLTPASQGLPNRTLIELAFLAFALGPLLHFGAGAFLGTFSSYVEKTRSALIHGAEDFLDMFSLLVMAAFVTALVHSTVDRSLFYSLGETPFLGIVVMMLLAVILSICSEADAFIAASFQLTLPLSAQMAFMVLGPIVDLKLIFMCLGVFKKRAILLVGGTAFLAVLGLMLVFDSYVRWALS